jgi:hypothetical protein
MREIVNGIFYVLRGGIARRLLLRMDQPQPTPRQGLRGHRRFSPRLPLRRLPHAARPAYRQSVMSFETDSKAPGRQRRSVPSAPLLDSAARKSEVLP